MTYYNIPITTLDKVITQSLLIDAPTTDSTATAETTRATIDTNTETYIKRLLYDVSDMMQKAFTRQFAPYDEAKVFYEEYLNDGGFIYDRYLRTRVMTLNHTGGDDCLNISAFDWNGTALTSSDYRFKVANISPNSELVFNPSTSLDTLDDFADSITVTGTWGYHDNYDDMWKDSGDTVQNATQISASGTSLTVVAGSNFEVYQLIRIESEYLFITDISGLTLTVERGKNGSTAAIHLNGVQIDTFVPMAALAKECRRLVLRAWYLKNDPKDNVIFTPETIKEIKEGGINLSIIPRLLRTYSF